VKTGIDAIESLFDSRRIGDASAQKFDLPRQVLSVSARQVIEHAYQCLCLNNASTRCDPRKPAPPVTRKQAIRDP
jgi:hypothetical protein